MALRTARANRYSDGVKKPRVRSSDRAYRRDVAVAARCKDQNSLGNELRHKNPDKVGACCGDALPLTHKMNILGVQHIYVPVWIERDSLRGPNSRIRTSDRRGG